jgi:hypothetical protein
MKPHAPGPGAAPAAEATIEPNEEKAMAQKLERETTLVRIIDTQKETITSLRRIIGTLEARVALLQYRVTVADQSQLKAAIVLPLLLAGIAVGVLFGMDLQKWIEK